VIFLPVFKFFISKKFPRWFSLTLVLLINLVIVYILALVLITSVKELRENLDEYQAKLSIYVESIYKIFTKFGIPFPKDINIGLLDPNLIFQLISNSLLVWEIYWQMLFL
jgi:predicted PurR-regulated permease PerM